MRGIEISIIILLASAIPATAQVDTLQLVEIGSIEAPGEITNLYVEDLHGDGLKEIILTTATNVHIYDGITYEEIWTSPELSYPRDLLFADMNLDGFTDFSAKTPTNISLFDPHNDVEIWTSPELDTTYVCYTIGDQNGDDWIDALIVDLVQTDSTYDYDTVWVSVYDGPSFTLSGAIDDEYPRFLRHDVWGGFWGRTEMPISLEVNKISESSGSPYIYVFSSYYLYYWGDNGIVEGLTGYVRAYNGQDHSRSYISETGLIQHLKKIHSADSTFLYFEGYEWLGGRGYEADIRFLIDCYPDTSMIREIWRAFLFAEIWSGSIIADIDVSHESEELCYDLEAHDESALILESLDGDTLWQTAGLPDYTSPISIIRSHLHDQVTMVLTRTEDSRDSWHYTLIDGLTGQVLDETPEVDLLITNVADLDNDGYDVCMSIQEDHLVLYDLAYRTDIKGGGDLLPGELSFSNYPNPFNSTTTIEYNLPEAGEVTINVFDLLGRQVETLINEKQDAGAYRITWDAGDRPSGVYFYRIKAGDYEDTRRMVILK